MFTKRSLRERGLRDSNKSGEQLTLPEIRGKATIEENEPYPITETCFWGGGRGETDRTDHKFQDKSFQTCHLSVTRAAYNPGDKTAT